MAMETEGAVVVMEEDEVEEAMAQTQTATAEEESEDIEEVIILTSDDFSNTDEVQYIQIQNEDGGDCEIEEGVMIGTVVHFPQQQDQENDQDGQPISREDCSQILQIAFNSVMNGSDEGTMQSGEIMQFEVTTNTQEENKESEELVENSDEECDDKDGSSGQDKPGADLKKSGEESSSEEDLTCIICGKPCTDQKDLQLHKMKHKEFSLPFKCAVCDEHFSKKSTLATHILEQHTRNSKTPYECGECNKQFSQESTWTRHKLNFHSTETDFSGPLACAICKRVFKSEEARVRHDTLVHEKVVGEDDEDDETIQSTELHKCSKCPLSFRTAEMLVRHSDAKHPGWDCLYCGKLFFRKALLRQHSREVHNSERPYACYKCWRRFTNGPDAKKHLEEFHNINIVRPVGVGRQKGDMYGTNYYEKNNSASSDVKSEVVDEYNKQKDLAVMNKKAKRFIDMIPEGVPDDPNCPNDLAARLKGVLTTEPHFIAKRKGTWKKPEERPGTSTSSNIPAPTPFFTPPPTFTPPPPGTVTTTMTTTTLKSKAKIKISSKPVPKKRPARIQKINKNTKVKTRRRGRNQNTRLDQPFVKVEDVCTKTAVILLKKLPETVLEEYQKKSRSKTTRVNAESTESESTSKLKRAVARPSRSSPSAGPSKTNSPQLASTSTGRPWRNVKSIYQYQSGK